MKLFAREFLESMSEEDRLAYFASLDPEVVWKMAEGNPKQDTDVTSNGESIKEVLVKFVNEQGPKNN